MRFTSVGPLVKKPMDFESGDQKGKNARSVPGSMRASCELRRRRPQPGGVAVGEDGEPQRAEGERLTTRMDGLRGGLHDAAEKAERLDPRRMIRREARHQRPSAAP